MARRLHPIQHLATFAFALIGLAVASPGRAAAPACHMDLIAEFKVKPGIRPTFETRVDGQPVRALLDTGAFSSVLTRSAANRLHLRPEELGGESYGVVGKRSMALATLNMLELGGGTFHRFKILVSDADLGDIDLLIGRDFLTPSNLEFDLAHGVVRMLRPHDCKSDQMVYWTDKPYSQATLLRSSQTDAFGVRVKLNAASLDAIIDSGAARSVASLGAATRARVPLTSTPGVFTGAGQGELERSLGTVASVSVGDETVKNARLEFADLFRHTGRTALGSLIQARSGDDPEMLIGADFLTSHHVLISPTQNLIFFTYEGGAPFAAGPDRPTAAPARK